MLTNHAGWVASPPLDATTNQPTPSGKAVSWASRFWPVLAPIVVRIRVGPIARPPSRRYKPGIRPITAMAARGILLPRVPDRGISTDISDENTPRKESCLRPTIVAARLCQKYRVQA